MSEEKPPIDPKLVHEGLRKAKANLVLDHPFFGSLALKLNYVATDQVKHMHVDGVNLFFNPENIGELNERQLVGGVAQNVMHCALGHVTRRGERDQKKWDRACDHVVNIILSECKDLELPPESPCDMQYKGMTAEVVYNKLEDEDDDKDGDGEGPPNFSGINDAPTEGSSKDDPSNGQGKTTQQSSKELDDDWKISAAQAAKAAKMQGNLPGGIQELMNDILAPKIEWKEVLRRFLTKTDKSDYTWSKGNRRYISQGLYLPSAWSEAMGEIVIVLDDSCSVSNDEIKQFQGEINAILDDCPPSKLTVLMCNTRVHRSDEYEPSDLPLKLKVRGSGGTNFEPAFDWVQENMSTPPECLVYLTDGYANTDFPEPDYPTLWIRTDRGSPEPEFGESVFLEISEDTH